MPAPPRRSAPFVGRTEELAALSDAFDAAVEGALVVTFVDGDRGAGKTALARAFVADLRRRGVAVHWGGATEVGGAPAFWPWIQVLRSLGDDAVAAAQAGLAVHAQEPFAAYDIVHEVLRARADEPRVLVLDDLHAADLPSLELLRFLVSAAHDLPILVVGTVRSGARRDDAGLDVLLADVGGSGRRVTPADLDLAEVAELLAARAGGATDLAADVLARSGGNAFYVEQLVEAVRRDGPDGLADLPDGVRAAVRTRLAPLPEPTRALLARSSILGPPFQLAVLAAMAGSDPGAVRAELAPAIDAGILTEDDAGLSFAHALVREAVAVDVDPLTRATAHHAAARAWSAGVGTAIPAAVIAQHLVDAGPVADPAEAATWATAAAEAARGLAGHREAARWFEEAARRWAEAGDADAQGEALTGAIRAHETVGDGTRALELSDDLALLARRTGSGSLLARAALARADVFEPAQGLDAPPLIREALGHPDVAGDLAVRADLLMALASLLGMPSIDGVRQDGEGARRAVAELDDLAAGGDPHARARLAEARLHVDSGPDHAADRRRWLAELDAALPPGPQVLERLARVYWATSLAFEAGDLREVDRRLREWEGLAERADSSYWRWRAQMARASLAYAHGRFEVAEQVAVDGLPLVADLNPEMGLLVVSGLVFAIRRDQGRIEELARIPTADLGALAPVVAADRGDVEEARRLLRQVVAMAETTGPDDLYWLCLLSVIATAAALVDDAERSAWVAARLEPHLDQVVMWGRSYVFGPPVAELVGTARAAAGDLAGAADAFRRSLRWADGADAPGFAVRARLGLARTLPPDDPERIDALAEAAAGARRLGMVALAAEADRLAAVGRARPSSVAVPPPVVALSVAPMRARIRTLGRFEVRGAGREEPARWSSRKARDALKLLISRRGRSVPREELIDALWPDVDLATARTRLSVVLSMVRSALDPDRRLATDPLQADRQAVALDLDLVDVDVERFLALAAAALGAAERGDPEAEARLAEAVAADEEGAFLAEDPYAEWADVLRATLDRSRRGVTRTLARLALARGAAEDAIGWWSRLVERDPDDEDAVTALVELLEAEGRAGEAGEVRSAQAARLRSLGLPAGD